MRLAVGTRVARYPGDIGLRLRVGVERDRKLRVDLPGVAERAAERRQPPPDRGGVPGSLRLPDHQEAVEQLQALAGLEHAQPDQALVLEARPAPSLRRRSDRGHRTQEIS